MILVTGGTGLVGAHLLLHLVENEDSIRAIYRQADAIKKTKSLFQLYQKEHLFTKIDWVLADIIDVPSLPMAFKNIDYVYHCAGLISYDPNDEELLRKINIEGTANIVNFCIDNKIKKLCHVSSIAALGNLSYRQAGLASHENEVTEDTERNPEAPHSDYAISKYGAEIEVWRAQQEGLDCVVINPGVILGITSNWDEGSGKIFKTISKGMHFYTKGTSGFVSVTDVSKIMFQLMNSSYKNEKYTVVAENIVFQDLINLIADGLKVKKPRFEAQKWLLELIWRIDWVSSNLFFQKRKLSKLMVKSLFSLDLYDNSKIKTTLDFKFESVDDCIKKTCEFYLHKNHYK